MSNIKLDLSKFKHVSSNDKTTKLKHSDGHFLVIKHGALNKSNQEQLGALSKIAKEHMTMDQANEMHDKPSAKMANGGEARQGYEEGGRAPMPSQSTEKKKLKPIDVKGGIPDESPFKTGDWSKIWKKAEGGQIQKYAEGTEFAANHAPKPQINDQGGDGKGWKPGTSVYEAMLRDDREGESVAESGGDITDERGPSVQSTRHANGGRVKLAEGTPGHILLPKEDYYRLMRLQEKNDNYGHLNETIPESDTIQPNMTPRRKSVQDPVDKEFNDSEAIAEKVTAPNIQKEINNESNALLNSADAEIVKKFVSPANIGNVEKKPEQDALTHYSHVAGKAIGNFADKATDNAFAPYKLMANVAGRVGKGLISGISGEPETPTTSQAPIQQAVQPQPMPPVEQPPAPLQNPSASQIQETQEAAGTPTLQSDIANVNNPMGMATQGFANQIQAENAKALALEGQAGNESAALYEDAQAKQRALGSFQDKMEELNNERLAHIQDIQDGHIDPNAYWKDHSKIATGIGMILAGFNPAGKPNAAIDFLKYQMDRNIDAQKANLNSKNNLLRANLDHFRNLEAATNMTRLMQNDVVTNQLLQAAAEAKTPLAKAAAQQAIGMIQQESAQRFRQLAMTQSVMGLAGSGDSQTEQEFKAMTGMMRMMGMSEQAKDMEAKRVPGVGTASKEVPTDVIKEITSHQKLDTAAKDLYQWAKTHSTIIPGTPDYNVGLQKALMIQNLYREGALGTVYKEGEQPLLDKVVNGNPAGFLKYFSSLPKLKEVIEANERSGNAVYKIYGLPEIKKHQLEPNIKTMGGVKYQQAPDGNWHKVK